MGEQLELKQETSFFLRCMVLLSLPVYLFAYERVISLPIRITFDLEPVSYQSE